MSSPQEPYIHGEIGLGADLMDIHKEPESSVHKVGKSWYDQMGVPLREAMYACRAMMQGGQTAEERAMGAAVLSKIYEAGYNITLITKIEEMESRHGGRISAANGTVMDELGSFSSKEEHQAAIDKDKEWLNQSAAELEQCYMMRDAEGFRDFNALSRSERDWANNDLIALEGVLGELSALNPELDERYELTALLEKIQNEADSLQEFIAAQPKQSSTLG